MSLYRFLTTFCIVPTYDWAAFGQRVIGFLRGLLVIRLLLKLLDIVFNVAKTPMYLGVIVLAITYFPDTIQWIFFKIGEIQIKCIMIILGTIMPDIFRNINGDFTSWKTIWDAGLNTLPSDWVAILNGVGVAELMGLISSTLTSGWVIRIYRKTMMRAGLL